MTYKNARQEGIMILLVIVAIGSTIIGAIQNNITLIFSGVAIILLDTCLLLDYNKRRNEEVTS